MEKITDKIAALPAGSSYFSLEFFPPKTQIVPYLPPRHGPFSVANDVDLGLLQSTDAP